MKNKITQLLLSLGIHSTYTGFHFLCRALELCIENEDYLLSIHKRLYVDIAAEFHTSRSNVEHCIRTVVSNCWNRGGRMLLEQISAYPLTEKPTNSEFIDILYHYLISQE